MQAVEEVNEIAAHPPTARALGLPVEPEILFADKRGVRKARIEKNRTHLLEKLGFLGRFLDADERIILVTTGCSPFGVLEQMTMGALWVVLLKRALFVFTNKRMFHIPTTANYAYRGALSQILYEDCCSLQAKGSMLVIEYRNGRKEKFYGIPGADRAIIQRLRLETSETDHPSDQPQRNHLCPNCTQILPTGAVTCPSCGLEFKSRTKALKYSLLVPGGGYFYTNHPFMGIGDAVVESYLLIITLAGLVVGLLGDSEAMSTALLFAIVLGIEKLVTIHHSYSFLSEYIPQNLKRLLNGHPAPTEPALSVPAVPQKTQRTEDILSVR